MRFLSAFLLRRGPNPSLSLLAPLRRSLSSIGRRLSLPAPSPVRERLRSYSISPVDLRGRGVVSVGTAFAVYSPLYGSMAAAAATAAAEASLARRFWIGARKEAVLAFYTPFVVCLASGQLKRESFRDCVAQNVHFLKAFAQAYEKAEEYTDEDDAKPMICMLRKAALDELNMYNSIVQEWGIDLIQEDVIPSPATVKYTNFLLATAAGKIESIKGLGKIATPFEKTKIAAYTVGAMTPCMRLYSFLGKEVQMLMQYVESDHTYKKWIEHFSSESFEAGAMQIEDLLDKLSVSLTGEELEVIQKLYHQAMKLLIGFFSDQLIVQPVVVPLIRTHDPTNRLVLFSDFDLTCTTVDSSAILAEIAIRTTEKADQNEANNLNSQSSSSETRNLWDELSRQYTEEYEQCVEIILKSEKAKAFDYEGLCKALEQLSNFEKRANSRVIESGGLKGMNLDDIKRAGKHLNFRDGCREFFQKVVDKKEKMNIDLHVLSYCWCADLIRSAFSSDSLNSLNIHCNEFEYKASISTGDIVRKMESPLNKVEAFKTILSNGGSNDKHLSVYIGDSVGDLLCLLEADVGIVVGSNASLRRVGEHFDVSFVPLSAGLVFKQKLLVGEDSCSWKGLCSVLYTVYNWLEIEAFILGNE